MPTTAPTCPHDPDFPPARTATGTNTYRNNMCTRMCRMRIISTGIEANWGQNSFPLNLSPGAT